MTDFKMQYGYLVYPYNEIVKDIFMKERITTKYIVESENESESENENESEVKTKKITTPQSIPKDFRVLLEDNGYKLIPVIDRQLCGIREICGNTIDITKLISDREIKALLIRVSGLNDDDLDLKMESIKNFLKLNFNLDFEKTDNFMFSRTDRC